MSKLVAGCVVLAALLVARLHAQVPGAYPHLQLTDGLSPLVPPASGPFDNSNEFKAFAGQSFQARISYASAGQPTTNVLWAIVVSASKTPFPTTVIPPKLLTMPPVILLLPMPLNLTASGQGQLNLFVPAGILDAQTYIQGLVYDSTHVPPMQLSNGLLVDVDIPSFGVDFAWMRASPSTDDESLLHDLGSIALGPEVLTELKPIGLQAPPQAIPGALFYPDDVRFLGIVPNEGDEPINPRSRPFTRVNAAASATDLQLVVQDTAFFPNRGKLLVAGKSANLWDNKIGGGSEVSPRVEVILYDGKLPDRFLNLKRLQVGTSIGQDSSTSFPHVVGETVLGEYTMATTSGARARTRIGLNAENLDMPHVVIPAYSAPTGLEGQPVTQDLDLFLFESKVNQAQGFVVFDRITHTWRVLEGSLKNVVQGRWNPMVCLAPDGRSFIAELLVSTGILGWDNAANMVFAIRTDGLDWPASGSESWQITYEVEPDPVASANNVRSRRVVMLGTSIIGQDPDNYVAFIGLAHKWKLTGPSPGKGFAENKGYEGEWVREEILVRDLIDVPLVAPGSDKAVPAMPRPYITAQFGSTGLANPITRFDPELMPKDDHKSVLLAAGGAGAKADDAEDVFLIRNVTITPAGAVNKFISNLTGFSANPQNAGATHVREFKWGGHGGGRRADFSPGGTRVAWTAKKSEKVEWLQWANTNGSSYGKVKDVYNVGSDTFKVSGPYQIDRIINGLRWIDENRILFMMGKNPANDVLAVTASNAPQFDLFVYDIAADLMTNVSMTGGGTGFNGQGRIAPGAYLSSPNGQFAYFVRGGGISQVGGSKLVVGTAILNLVGVNLGSLQAFPVTGTEFSSSALVADLDLPAPELISQVESPATMRFVEGSGVQQGLIYFTAHKQGGNGSDEVIGANLDMPFVAFQATKTAKSGLAITDIVPDPYGGKVAFARTDTAVPFSPTQHPFVVDLDNFLFERDLLPMWTAAGANMGRVMGGSYHFIAPVGSAGDALVFSYGFGTLPNGIALMATPAYYPLAAVSDLVAQPVPIVIPLIDTLLLGTDYRFYLPHAGPAGE